MICAHIMMPCRRCRSCMRNTITVMNAKGGVGKSTLVLALAETLSPYHDKDVLVVDAGLRDLTSELLRRLEAVESKEVTSAAVETVTDERRGKRSEGMMKAIWTSWKERRMP